MDSTGVNLRRLEIGAITFQSALLSHSNSNTANKHNMKLSTVLVLQWLSPAPFFALGIESSSTAPSCDGDFNDGVYLGADIAESIWKDLGSSCGNIWYFEDDVDEYLKKYPTDTSNWKKNSCHEGMQKGADQVVQKYEKKCLDDSPDECYDLGQAAAQRELHIESFVFQLLLLNTNNHILCTP